MTDNLNTSALIALLKWYREMGLDESVSKEPINWLERGATPPGVDFHKAMRARNKPPSAPEPQAPGAQAGLDLGTPKENQQFPGPTQSHAPPPRRLSTTLTPEQSLQSAQEAAQKAQTLSALNDALLAFDGCGLKATAKNTCFYRGAEQANLVIIGEAPGRDEDLQGRPFVGRAGKLLDLMLASIGLNETNTHITNIVYWRPPGNRTPTPQEAQICRPFLERQIELVKPKCILLLGGAAAKHILETTQGIMRLRGKWRQISLGPTKVHALATLHPAYLLRTPAAKRLAWQDLISLQTKLKDD